MGTLRKLVVGTRPFGADTAIPPVLRPCNASGLPSEDANLDMELDLATYEASIFNGFQGTVQYNNEVPAIANVAVLYAAMTNRSLGATPLYRLAYVQAAEPARSPHDLMRTCGV